MIVLDSKGFWYSNMAACFVGWLFVAYGVILPFEAGSTVRTVWLVILLILMTHVLEMPKAIPIGKEAGCSLAKTVIYTMLFGLTWWLPLKRGVFKE